MKRLLILPLFLLLLVGCSSNNKIKQTVCTGYTSLDSYDIDMIYTIIPDGSSVKTLKLQESYSVDTTEYADEIERFVKNTYETASELYGGYTIDITRKENTIYANVNIDYTKIDVDSLLKDSPDLEKLYENKKLSYKKVKEYYEKAGLSCEEEKN